MQKVRIEPVDKAHGLLGLGGWVFGGRQWGGQKDEDCFEAMAAALDREMNHFDTAEMYSRGRSEELVGEFLAAAGRRERVFLATKVFPREVSAEYVARGLELSLKRLRTDCIDLYYCHWPRQGMDMRPVMEGLERARRQGKIRAIGVSNFSVEQMQQVAGAGRIDAHQLNYSLLWRFHEPDVIPYCREHGIAVVTYSSLAQGILTGKFPRRPQFREGDGRKGMLMFREGVWPHVYEAVEKLKAIAAEVGRPLTHLAIRWVAARTGVTSVLLGARNARQVHENADAMDGEIPPEALDRMTAVSDEVMPHLKVDSNIFGFHP